MNIVEAYDGPFASWLGNPAQWAAWRVFLKSLSGVSLLSDEVPLFSKCTGRTVPFAAPVSEAWVVAGRRARKSAVAATLGVHAAVFCDWSKCIAPGETARVLVIAVTKSQAKIIKGYCEAIFQSHPQLAAMIETTTQESIVLKNGIEILVVANNFRSIRGPAVVACVMEELAFWMDENSAQPDVEILRAIRPAMLTTKKHGALLIGISSPYAKKGLLYSKWKEHFGQDNSNVLVWQAPTELMNPEVDPAEIEQAYKDDPASAAAEYGAQFRDDIQNFLDADLLSKLVRNSPLELPPQPGIKYFGFVDPSGGRGDAYTLGISHREKSGKIILDVVRATQPPFDPAIVTKDYSALLKQYRISEITGDAYGGEWPRKEFEESGIRYRVSAFYKSQIYLESLPLFTRGEVELPDLRQLLVELAQLERRTQRGGKDSVDHPSRCHDDMANVACGALHLAALSKNSIIECVPIPNLSRVSPHDMNRLQPDSTYRGNPNSKGDRPGRYMDPQLFEDEEEQHNPFDGLEK